MSPTPDHKWLRSILLDPSPTTFAVWSDWLREQGRDEEADIAAQGRVPVAPGGLVWWCFELLRCHGNLAIDPRGITVVGLRDVLEKTPGSKARWVLEGDAPAVRGG